MREDGAGTEALRASVPSFCYGAREVIRGVDLAFRRPGLVALLGPNGSGKSTLLRIVGGLLRGPGVSVLIEGQALAGSPIRRIASQVAWVPQRAEVPFALTVREMILIGRYRFQRPMRPLPVEEEGRILEVVDSMGLAGLIDREVGTLSGGEWQRALIARAVAQETPILLLDEPVASLDLHYQDEVYLLLRRLVAGGRLVIVADHHMEVAASYADRSLVLKDGAVAADGPPGAVLTARLIQEVFGVRRDVFPDPSTGSPRLARPRGE